MRRFVSAVLLLLAACGGDPPIQAEPPERWTGDPAADVEAARDTDDWPLVLETWPVERDGYRKSPITQGVLAARVAMRLEAGRVLEAYDDSELLRVRFGESRALDGTITPISVVRAAIFDAAIEKAKTLVAGDRPDRAKAQSTLKIATQVRTDDDEARLARTHAWVEANTLDDLAPGTPWNLDAHDGPRVVVVTDHFTLGEARVRAVLERWSKHSRLRVSLVPVWRNEVRAGMRRVPSERKDERTAVRAAARQIGLHYEAKAGSARWSRLLELGRTASAVFILNADGIIVSRLRENFPSLQQVEGSVQRVTTR